MADKSAGKSVPGKPFETGEDKRRGRGPKKGAPNAGRPRNEFVREMQSMVWQPAARRRLKKILTSAKTSDDVFLKAFKEVADRGHGKAVQPLEHAGPDGGPIPLEGGDDARARIARELDGIASRRRAKPDPRGAN